ncbi:hypothetical protein ACGFIJ_08985 [Microbispora bryophytorum]
MKNRTVRTAVLGAACAVLLSSAACGSGFDDKAAAPAQQSGLPPAPSG